MKHQLDQLDRIKDILAREIRWYKKSLSEFGEDFVYDESCFQITSLSRGECAEILKILAEEN
jgi:hypothetical protein